MSCLTSLLLALATSSSFAEPTSNVAPAALEAACVAGQRGACAPAGLRYVRGLEVEPDPSRAAALFERGCDAGDMEACALLGMLYQAGIGVARDEVRAAGLLVDACDAGVRFACEAEEMPLIGPDGLGAPRDRAPAAGGARPEEPPQAPAARASARPEPPDPPEDDEDVRRRARRILADVRRCLGSHAPGPQTPYGEVWAAAIVAPSGAVSSVSIARSTVQDVLLDRCVVSSVGRALFPPVGGEAARVVVYPLSFGRR
jgi:hypothetical protein